MESLVLNGLYELCGTTTNPEYRLDDPDYGEPEPITTVIARQLLDGDIVTGSRSGNRNVSFTVPTFGSSRTDLAEKINRLITIVYSDQPFTLKWTPDGGLPLVFDCYRGPFHRQRLAGRDVRGVGQVTLKFQASPFGRSDAPQTVAVASPQLQVDAMTTTPTGATADTVIFYEAAKSAKVTFTRTLSGDKYGYTMTPISQTIAAVDLSAFASIGVRFRWAPPAAYFAWPVSVWLTLADGTDTFEALATVVVANGATDWKLLTYTLADFDADGVNLAAVTSWSIRATATANYTIGTPSATVNPNFDDLRVYPSASAVNTTTEGVVLSVPSILGTARNLPSVTLTRPAAAVFTDCLCHCPPASQHPDAQILAALSGSPKTVTIAAANNTLKGTYAVVLIGTNAAASGTRTVGVTVAHKQGATTLATTVLPSVVYATRHTGPFVFCGEITLPLVDVPDENVTDTLVITVSTNTTSGGGTVETFSSVMLIDLEGQLFMAWSLPAATTAVYVDAPLPPAEVGLAYGTVTDRTAATGVMASTHYDGPLEFEPGDNKVLTASSVGPLDFAAAAPPCWLDERTA